MLLFNGQFIMVHAFHVLLYHRFQLFLHAFLLRHFSYQVFFQQHIGLEGIHGYCLFAVKLKHVVAFEELVDSVQVVHGVSLFHRRMQ